MSIIIDQEFKSLIPPLSQDERDQLEQNILENGIRDALVVWDHGDGNAILVDGHNRWEIAAAHGGIPFRTEPMSFASREEAKIWILKNQLGRRNLHTYDRIVISVKLKPLIAKLAEQNLHLASGKGCQKSDKVKPIDTKRELAKIAGVSHDTIHKVEVIENEASDRTKQLAREGKLSINQAYNSTRPKRQDPVKQAKEEHEEFLAKKADKVVSFEDVQMDKINQRILNSEMMQDIYKLFNHVRDFGLKYKDEDLDAIRDRVTDEERDHMKRECLTCQATFYSLENYFC